jgi:hypothetical protein
MVCFIPTDCYILFSHERTDIDFNNYLNWGGGGGVNIKQKLNNTLFFLQKKGK